jgi:hypothetical protein
MRNTTALIIPPFSAISSGVLAAMTTRAWRSSRTCVGSCHLPRKASLSGYTNKDIDSIIWNLNTTPRKCLGFKTPIEAFASQLGVALEM